MFSSKNLKSTPYQRWWHVFSVALSLCISGLHGSGVFAQNQLSVVRDIELNGLFESLVGDEMTIVAADGKEYKLRIQADPAQPIGLAGGDIALQEPATINVKSTVTPSVLQEGMAIAFQCRLGKGGKTEAVTSATLLPIGSVPKGISVESIPTGQELVDATVEGVIKSINARRLVLSVPKHDLAPRKSLALDAEAISQLTYDTASLRMLRKGDVINRLGAADLSTGDSVIRRIDIATVGIRDDLNLTVDEQLQLRHYKLPNDSAPAPRKLESEHFLLTTDISERQAYVLLDKLEGMFQLVANYYGTRPGTQIEVCVVDDLNKWDMSEWDPRVISKVRKGEGTTVYRRVGSNQQAVVFSANKHDVVQHEAVHGFCFLAFQGTGPLWYAEGMAEMGQYWKADDVSVSANPAVIGYLRSRPPHPLKSIINAKQIEGETWKAYAWRWALCHFLATNPNYSDRFRRLGAGLMKEAPRASFENTWRRQANELTFEYEHFLSHLEAGLRADLMAWEWDDDHNVTGSRAIQRKISAARGWQSTGAVVKKGVTYETRGKGQWKLSPDSEAVNANGDVEGQGQLIGVIMNDYQLTETFELGTDPDFTASSDGVLYVRCRERMSRIADNEGEIDFAIRQKK